MKINIEHSDESPNAGSPINIIEGNQSHHMRSESSYFEESDDKSSCEELKKEQSTIEPEEMKKEKKTKKRKLKKTMTHGNIKPKANMIEAIELTLKAQIKQKLKKGASGESPDGLKRLRDKFKKQYKSGTYKAGASPKVPSSGSKNGHNLRNLEMLQSYHFEHADLGAEEEK